MDEIGDGIYVGSWRAEADLAGLEAANITRIVSVLKDFKPSHPEFEYLVIPELDMLSSNLLQYFNKSYKFIGKALSENRKILIHCAAGQSRSTTIAAAYLMKSRNISVKEALGFIKKSRPQIHPNLGFIEQLEIYKKMNFEIDINQSLYRNFLNEMAHKNFKENGTLENVQYAQDPANAQAPANEVKKRHARCKKCRRVLLDESNIIKHKPKAVATNNAAFNSSSKANMYSGNHNLAMLSKLGINPGSTGLSNGDSSCSSIFVEPMSWINCTGEAEISDKIGCPKCDAKLGQYNWSGSQCSCGVWVTPSFQIHKSRIDFV